MALAALAVCRRPLQGAVQRLPLRRSLASTAAAPPGDDCWRCGTCENKWKLFCGSCDALQPPPSGVDYFAMFELPTAYDVDLSALEAAYKNIQKRVHPDLQSGREDVERQLADDVSAHFNDAYKVLRDPIQRAQHLLSLKADDPLAEDSRAPVEPDVLMAVMEAREALSSAVSAEQLEDIARANKAKQDSSLAGLRSAFEQEDLGEASKLLVRLQYYTKIAKEVEARGEALGVEVGGAA